MASSTSASEPAHDLHLHLEGFQEKLCNNLYALWKSSQLCDLTLNLSGGDVIRTHSILLAAFSPTIAGILSNMDNHLQETGDHSQRYLAIVVNKFSLDVMKCIVSSIYTGRLDTSAELLEQLLDASRWLKMQDLVALIEHAIEEHRQPSDGKTSCFNRHNENGNESSASDDVSEIVGDKRNTQDTCDITNSKGSNTPASRDEIEIHPSSITVSKCSNIHTHLSSVPKVSTDLNANFTHNSPTFSANLSNDNNDFLPTPSSSSTFSNHLSGEPRQGSRSRKKSKKWMENYITCSLLGKKENNDNLECFVPVIKIEPNDLSSFLSSSDQLNAVDSNSAEDCNDDYLPVSLNEMEMDDGRLKAILDSGNMDMSEFKDNFQSSGERSEKNRRKRKTIQEVSMFLSSDGGNVSVAYQNRDVLNEQEIQREPSPTSLGKKGKRQKRDKKSYSAVRKMKAMSKLSADGRRTAMAKEPSQTCSPLPCSVFGVNMPEGSQEDSTAQVDDVGTEIKEKFPLKCNKCNWSFSDVKKYEDHINNHPLHICEECGAVFYLKHILTRHRYALHLNNQFLHCKECSFVAHSAKELCRHSDLEHNQPKPFQCSHPGCSFRARKFYAAEAHADIHSTEKKFFCGNCGNGYKSMVLLKSHRQSCLRKEEYLCDLCGQGFNAKAYLLHHRNTVHLGVRPHKCKQCFKSFSSSGNLKRHMRVHNNAYPYPCPFCDKKFRHTNTRKDHVETQHKAKEGIAFEEELPTVGYNYKRSHVHKK